MTAPTKADTAAAERLLKKAVKRAASSFASVETFGGATRKGFDVPGMHTVVVAMLTAAGQSAALLLGEDAS
jgi:hypothetical protein